MIIRAAVWILVLGQMLLSLPVASAATLADEQKSPEPAKVQVNRTQPSVRPPPLTPLFSVVPTDDEIFQARVFAEPLVPMGDSTSPADNRALAQVLSAYVQGGQSESVAGVVAFLGAHPRSPWRASLLTNLGIVYRRTGYFTRALAAWAEGWQLGKGATDPRGQAIADRAVGELAELRARLGRFDELKALFADLEGRSIRGSAAEKIANARAGFSLMENKPENAYRCGPMALDRILAYRNAQYHRDQRIIDSRSTPKGTSLLQMRDLARELGLRMQMAQRHPGASILVPAMVHWKAGHFAALVREENGRYLIQDPTFGDELWVTRQALDDEASGYFLVLNGVLPHGWIPISEGAGSEIWGKGNAGNSDNKEVKPDSDPVKPGGGCPSPGMATYNVHALLVSLNITDTPVGYSPPVGPSVQFTATYNQRDAFQPEIFSYSNLGHQWTFDWLSYVEDNPGNLTESVNVYRRGGGLETYSGFDSGTQSYAPDMRSRAIVVRTDDSPIGYERRLPDGSVEVFSQADGSGTFPRRIFMTESRDPQGNSVKLTYDASLRLVTVEDATGMGAGPGQITTLSYDDPSDDRRITKVTDPFGRFATFEYNAAGQLIKITDVIGIESTFSYGAGDFIQSLTTPYGTTSFSFGQAGIQRWLETEDPVGGRERVEYRHEAPGIAGSDPGGKVPTGIGTFNAYLEYRNTFFWDKRAMALYPGQYTKAKITHWLHTTDVNVAAGVKESEKMPLENRVWYAYPDQNLGPQFVGTSAQPIAVGRVLDDGTSQIYRYEYNARGRRIKAIDPVGRETVFVYGAGSTPDADQANGTGIDLLQVRQTNGGGYDVLAGYTYSAQHRPLTTTDTSGQTTTYTYNAQGQIVTVTTPQRAGITENRTTTYNYDANGHVQTIVGPTTGATMSYGYDGYGRTRTVTGAEGFALTTDYDALDRQTNVTYPDGTYLQTVYDRLDVSAERDGLGQWTHYFHDALQRLVSTRDPAGRPKTLQWCNCGSLDRLIDGNGNATTWERDLQGRATREIRADTSATTLVYEGTTSRLKQRIDAKNQTATYHYFTDNAMKEVAYTNAQNPTATVSFTFDPVYPRRISMTDGTGTTTYTYKPVSVPPQLGASSLATEANGTATLMYSYDELGRVVGLAVNGVGFTDSYDTIGRLAGETNPLGAFTYAYVGATSRPANITYPNGQTTTYSYFDLAHDQRLQEIKNLDPAAAVLSKSNYTYDAVGGIKTWSQQVGANPAKTYTLGYDAAHQLTSGVISGVSPTPVPSRFGYGYDNAGNRTSEQLDDAVTGATYNNLNQIVSTQAGGSLIFRGSLSEPSTVTIGGKPAQVAADNTFQGTATVSSGTSNVAVAATDASGNTRTNTYQMSESGSAKAFTYDLNGNLTNDAARTYEWDAEDRLIAINIGTHRTEFGYDGDSRANHLVEKDNGAISSDHRLVWCGQVNCEERNSSDGSVVRRLYNDGVQEGGSAYFYARDHLGNIREVTDVGGTVRARYDYDPYGRVTKLSGDKDSPLAYSGHTYHLPSHLTLALYRSYNSDTGQWLSRDPIGFGDGPNLYSYVAGDPVNKTDSLGLLAVVVCPSSAGFPDSGAGLCCNGGGGYAICYSQNGWDTVSKDPILRDCVEEHESKHIPQRRSCTKNPNCDEPPCTPLQWGSCPAKQFECHAYKQTYRCFERYTNPFKKLYRQQRLAWRAWWNLGCKNFGG